MDMKIDRRSFVLTGTTAIASTALVLQPDTGRERSHLARPHRHRFPRAGDCALIASQLKDEKNVEMTAVCDLWKVNREKAAAAKREGLRPRPARVSVHGSAAGAEGCGRRDRLHRRFPARPHSKLAVEAARTPTAKSQWPTFWTRPKPRATRSVKSDRIVQIGTQHRSEPYQIAARDLIAPARWEMSAKSRSCGTTTAPAGAAVPKSSRSASRIPTGSKWLLSKPYRPFDPRLYFEFRLYKDFSSGIADQWMSHGIDLVHYFLDDHFPRSVMAHGGVFAWPDGRENPDTFQALLEYPKGFLVSYSTSFGNDSESFSRYHGQEGAR